MTEQSQPESRPQQARLRLLAGEDPQGRPVMEQVDVYVLEEKDGFELLRSPLFVRNLAAGDIFRLVDRDQGQVEVLQRSGKLAIRVISRDNIEPLAEQLTPDVEKLGGSLDLSTERALVYSLHVNIGFAAVEQLFDNAMTRHPETVWYYGNIYDPADGVTPLHWWDAFINQT